MARSVLSWKILKGVLHVLWRATMQTPNDFFSLQHLGFLYTDENHGEISLHQKLAAYGRNNKQEMLVIYLNQGCIVLSTLLI